MYTIVKERALMLDSELPVVSEWREGTTFITNPNPRPIIDTEALLALIGAHPRVLIIAPRRCGKARFICHLAEVRKTEGKNVVCLALTGTAVREYRDRMPSLRVITYAQLEKAWMETEIYEQGLRILLPPFIDQSDCLILDETAFAPPEVIHRLLYTPHLACLIAITSCVVPEQQEKMENLYRKHDFLIINSPPLSTPLDYKNP